MCLRAMSGLLQSSCSRLQSCSGVEYRSNEDQSVSEAAGPHDCVVSAPEPLTAEPVLEGAVSWNVWKCWRRSGKYRVVFCCNVCSHLTEVLLNHTEHPNQLDITDWMKAELTTYEATRCVEGSPGPQTLSAEQVSERFWAQKKTALDPPHTYQVRTNRCDNLQAIRLNVLTM
ncbi:hypothetical protein GOODEAATRI_007381 [Goodea atripinnis]|uniref:Uncharacterized protein n=1 Tax=Goodea atripinnis TaxID=208336 RepID=A0ABV0PW26_9TELE